MWLIDGAGRRVRLFRILLVSVADLPPLRFRRYVFDVFRGAWPMPPIAEVLFGPICSGFQNRCRHHDDDLMLQLGLREYAMPQRCPAAPTNRSVLPFLRSPIRPVSLVPPR